MTARMWFWLSAALVFLLMLFLSPLLWARMGLLDETISPTVSTASQATTATLDEAATGPIEIAEDAFRPGALRALIERKQPEGIEATVDAYYDWMRANLARVRAIDDYSMTLIKRERINGKLWPEERMKVKVRHRPFSVYLLHEEPKSLAGQEAIFVEGKNGGRLIGHSTGVLGLVGRLRLDPRGKRAMQGNLHPIMEIGLIHMVEQVVVGIPRDIREKLSTFSFRTGVDVGGRSCTTFLVQRTAEGSSYEFHHDEMFIDDEWLVPIHYFMYDWPETPGGEPVLRCEYTHEDLKFNNGFTDRDFDPDNPDYDY